MTNDTSARCLRLLEEVLVQQGELAKAAAGGNLLELMDSITLLNFVVSLEKEFGIQVMVENLDEVFRDLDSLTIFLNHELAA